MKRRQALLLVLAFGAFVGASLTSAASAAPAAAAAVERSRAEGVPAVPAGVTTSARAGTAPPERARAARPPRSGAAAAAGARRTLEEIHIEGEVPAPQVLFVTARDQRRFLESHHRRYLATSLELAERSTFPTWFAVTRRPAPRP